MQVLAQEYLTGTIPDGQTEPCQCYLHCPHLICCNGIPFPGIVTSFRRNKKKIHRSQETQNHIHDTTTRITTDLSQVLETTVQGWQYCDEICGDHIELYTVYVYVF